MLVFYPAVMSSDSTVHWQEALSNQYSTWRPPFLSMLMHLTQHVVKNPSLFSFIQGSLFWGALFYLIRKTARSDRSFLVNSTVIILLPPLWLYSNAAISNTWMAAFLVLSIAFLIEAAKNQREISFFFSLLSLSLAVMFRFEAVVCVLVPIVIYLFGFKKKRSRFKKAAAIPIAIAICIMPSMLIERSPRVVHRPRTQAHGLFNQYVGTIVNSKHLMTQSQMEREEDSIDREFGKGVFRKLISNYDCRAGDYIIFKRHGQRVLRKIPPEKIQYIVRKVIQTAWRHPVGYIKHQVCYFGHLSQFSKTTYQSWGVLKKEPNLEAARSRLGLEFKSKLPSVRAGYVEFMNSLLKSPVLSFLFKHYIFLILSAVFLVVGFLTRKTELMIVSLLSLVYPVGFLIAGPAGLWRYLMISYLGAWTCLLAVLPDILIFAKKRIRRLWIHRQV